MNLAQKALIASALLTAGLFVAGVTVLFGYGWGLIAGSAASGLVTVTLLKGIKL